MKDDDFCLVSVATFDKLADRYAEQYFHSDIYDRYLEEFAKRIRPQGARVLDAACGPGNISAFLARARPDLELVGVDLAEGMVRQAVSRVPGAKFLIKDCRKIDTLEEVFDACAFGFGLSYLTDDDAQQFFASLNASLTESATLYLSTITGERRGSGFEESSTGEKVYLEYRNVGDVVSMVEKAGYRIDSMDVVASPANATQSTQDLVLIAQREISERKG